MADSFIVLPPDSTGKAVDTSSLVVGGNTVQRERDNIADPTDPSGLAKVENTNPGASDYGLVVRPIENTDTAIGGTAAPNKLALVGGKTNDGTPQYQPIPLSGGGGSIATSSQMAANSSLAVWNSTTALNTTATILTSATTLTPFNTVLVELDQDSGTFTAGAIIFEGSMDGNDWTPIIGYTQGGIAYAGATSFITNSILYLQFGLTGWLYFRARLATAITGTGNVTIQYGADAASTVTGGTVRAIVNPLVPTILQKGNAVTGGANTSLTFTFPNPISPGSTILVMAACSAAAIPTISDGLNTYVSQASGATAPAFRVATASKCVAGSTTITVTATSGAIALQAYEIAGVTVDGFVYDYVTSVQSVSTAGAFAAVSALSANDIVFIMGASGAAATLSNCRIAGVVATPPTFPPVSFDALNLAPAGGAALSNFNAISVLENNAPSYSPVLNYNASTAQSACIIALKATQLSVTANVTGQIAVSGVPYSGAAIVGPVSVSDAGNYGYMPVNSTGANTGAAVAMMASSGNSSNATWVPVKTPTVYKGAIFSAAGPNVIWQPPATLKARLMRYKIEVAEDCTISGGPLPIYLAINQAVGTASGAKLTYSELLFYHHRVVLPATVLATSGELYASEWMDLGNGVINDTAGTAIIAGIQVAQSTSAVNPTWTITSNQWECATLGFKTTANAGAFKLLQQNNGVASASSVALSAMKCLTGDTIVVVFRTTNPVGGAPTVTVTDTAGNTYTTAALSTNATDSANGSSLGIAYCVNIVGNAANVITVTTSVNLSTQIEAIALEYGGLGSGGIDAAKVGATGSSTAPAAGNYTPGTAGDLIINCFASAATMATVPTVGSGFTIRGLLYNATQGSLGVCDNFGNGALLAGQINLICVGTEE